MRKRYWQPMDLENPDAAFSLPEGWRRLAVPADQQAHLVALIEADAWRCHVLSLVQRLGIPDAWVGAGFVRNAVWDALYVRAQAPVGSDVDVIWFDAQRCDPACDAALMQQLCAWDARVPWSVTNQARMHRRNGDAPYRDATHAMRHWPETATAVAVRRERDGRLAIAAPFGLHDLYQGVIAPTPRFVQDKRAIFAERLAAKQWPRIWPALRVCEPAVPEG
jgi:hypothetical protein